MIDGRRVFVYSQDFTVSGGTVSSFQCRPTGFLLRRMSVDQLPVYLVQYA